MRIVIGIIIAAIALVVGCATLPEPVPDEIEQRVDELELLRQRVDELELLRQRVDELEIAETQYRQTEPPSYEVVRTYTVEVIVGRKPSGPPGGAAVELRARACVEIKNTGNTAGLFSVCIFFSEVYSGQELLYLKPGETGVATYTPFQTFEEWRTQRIGDFPDRSAEWEYEITPVALNQSPKN